MRFYNERRKQLLDCNPNAGHVGLAKLEELQDKREYDVVPSAPPADLVL